LSIRWQLWSLASPSQLLLGAAIAGGLLLALAGGRGAASGRAVRAGRWLAVAGGAGLLVFGLLPTSHYIAHALEARFPRPSLPDEVAGIVLLAGSERPAASDAWGEPQLSDAGSRYVAALRLAARYPQARLVHSGDTLPAPGAGLLGTQSGVAHQIFGGIGLDPARVSYESESRDTCEHAPRVRAVAQPQPGETWVVVSSAMHLPRVVGCFRAAGWSDVVPYPTDYRVVLGGWRAASFRIAVNLQLFDAALHEWVGLAYYRLTGRIAEIFPGP
jgi:uncharacterized SAM-binding protein YcdF (DUF218 family)